MKENATIEEMEIVLNELNEQFETLKENEARIPQIEIDIMMANIRKLYDCMSHLNRLKEQPRAKTPLDIVPEIVVPTTAISEVEEAIQEQKETIEEIPTMVDEDLSYENITNDFLEEIDNLEELAESELEEAKAEEVQAMFKPEAPKEEKPKSSLLLQFEDEMFSVNESVAQKSKDKSVVSKLSNTRIENLKSAIGINDKFYFINELFSGNSQAYEDVIYALNNFKRFEEAMQYISTLKYRYDWDTEAEAYQKLVHFLERKFVEIHA